MGEAGEKIIVLILGGVLGVFGRYYYDYKGSVYRQLWTDRYREYQKLFTLTGLMPQYPKKTAVTYLQLLGNSEAMRDWYFNEGGLLASSKTRNKYFKLQRMIQQMLTGITAEDMGNNIDEEKYENVRILMSQLRKVMTDDLMSRSRI